MSKFNQFVGSQIFLFRKGKKITQVDFAKAINISRSQAANLESGATGTTGEMLFNICIVLGCEISDLFPKNQKELVDFVPATKILKTEIRLKERIEKYTKQLNDLKTKQT